MSGLDAAIDGRPGWGELWAEVAERIPLDRWARAEEQAEVIRFLASPAAGHVTGAALPVDGESSTGAVRGA